jgi:hypothetical protein
MLDTLTMLELAANFDCSRQALDSGQLRVSSELKVEKLILLSHAFKFLALPYGTRVLSTFKNSRGNIAVNKAFDNKKLALEILSTIESLQPDAALFKCLLWPIFIVGLECQADSEQKLVIEFLKKIWNLTSCLNVINAVKILHDCWERKSLDSDYPRESATPVYETGWLLV